MKWFNWYAVQREHLRQLYATEKGGGRPRFEWLIRRAEDEEYSVDKRGRPAPNEGRVIINALFSTTRVRTESWWTWSMKVRAVIEFWKLEDEEWMSPWT